MTPHRNIDAVDAGWIAIHYAGARRDRAASVVQRLAGRIVWTRAWLRETIAGAGTTVARGEVMRATMALDLVHREHREAVVALAHAERELAGLFVEVGDVQRSDEATRQAGEEAARDPQRPAPPAVEARTVKAPQARTHHQPRRGAHGATQAPRVSRTPRRGPVDRRPATVALVSRYDVSMVTTVPARVYGARDGPGSWPVVLGTNETNWRTPWAP